jgi:hypothetical protein
LLPDDGVIDWNFNKLERARSQASPAGDIKIHAGVDVRLKLAEIFFANQSLTASGPVFDTGMADRWRKSRGSIAST